VRWGIGKDAERQIRARTDFQHDALRRDLPNEIVVLDGADAVADALRFQRGDGLAHAARAA